MKFMILSFAAGQGIKSLELEAFMHSGTDLRRLPLSGVFVSKQPGVSEEDYYRILEDERYAQNYRFLSELEVAYVEIAPAGQELELKTIDTPSPIDVRTSVTLLENALENRNIKHTPPDLTQQIINLPSEKARVNAWRRVIETTFFIERYDALLERFAGAHDIDEDDSMGRRKYSNQWRTRPQEMRAAYEHLFQRTPSGGMDTTSFDLNQIEFKKLINFKENGHVVPLKLVIPSDKVEHVFDSTRKGGHVLFGDRMDFFDFSLAQWYDNALEQASDYAAFNLRPQPKFPELGGDLQEDIETVKSIRAFALDQYQHFRIPYPTVEHPQFYIYAHDPENRVQKWDVPRKAFPSLVKAYEFYSNFVLPSFNRIPSVLYRDRLRDVVLFAHDTDHLGGRTTRDGISMLVIDPELSLLFVERIIRHECGHVFDAKIGPALRAALLLVIKRDSPVFSPTIEQLLASVYNQHFRPLPGVKFDDFKYTSYSEDKERMCKVMERFLEIWGKQGQTQLAMEIQSTSVEDCDRIRALIKKYRQQVAEITRAHYKFSSTNINADGHVTYYAYANVRDDIAETTQQLCSKRLRLALFLHAAHDVDMERKLDTYLRVVGNALRINGESDDHQSDRLQLVKEWQSARAVVHQTAPATVRYTVIIYGIKGEETVDTISAAEDFAVKMLEAGHEVSVLHFLETPSVYSIDISAMVEQRHVESGHSLTYREVHAFTRSSVRDRFLRVLDLTSVLHRSGIDLDGQEVFDSDTFKEDISVHAVGSDSVCLPGSARVVLKF